MKLEPKAGPSIVQPTGAKSSSSAAARDRAIAMLVGQSAQPQAVPNATSISPEEMGAVKAPVGQMNISEDEASPVVETAEAIPAEATPEEETLSSRYANLARKEKQLRLREQQIKAKEASMKPAVPATPEAPKFDPSKYVDKEMLMKQPFAVLNEMGLGYEELTNLALNAPSAQDLQRDSYIKKLEAKINDLESSTKSVQQKIEEQETNSRTRQVKQVHSDVKRLVSQDPSFETIKETGSEKEVVNLIMKTLDEDGILMSAEDAAKEVEDYISNQLLNYAQKINKVKSKLQPMAPSATKQPQSNQQPQLKTLTNSMSTSRQLSAKERAILAFQGKLPNNG